LAGVWAPSFIFGSIDLLSQLGRGISRSHFREKSAGETAQDCEKKAWYLSSFHDIIDIMEERKLVTSVSKQCSEF